jgi:hypothetical protein
MLPEEKLLSDLFEINLPTLKSVYNNDPNDIRFAPKKNYEDSIRVIKKHLKTIDAEKLAEYLYNWLKEQKYGNENILHAAVCCDYVGLQKYHRLPSMEKRLSHIIRFKKAIAELITKYLENENK